MSIADSHIGCPACGLVHTIDAPLTRGGALCTRCGATMWSARRATRMRTRTAAWSLAGLILFVPAVTWPLLRIERMGHVREDGIVGGVLTLLRDGHLFIGVIVLVFSLIVPPAKLTAMLWLATGGLGAARRHQALAHHLVDFLGRWGMLDVLLVAVLVAFVKLGDVIAIQAGPGLIAFALCVLCSLAASIAFDPREMWRGEV
jgi:uncharacterized paraquat-inducible protein A